LKEDDNLKAISMTYKGPTLTGDEGDVDQSQGVRAFGVPGTEISQYRALDIWCIPYLLETLL